MKKNYYKLTNFIFRLIYIFYNTNGTTRAGSLSFTFLLSFIPFTITIGGIIGKLPYSNYYIVKIEQYIFTNYIPHDGIKFYQHIKLFLQQSNNLSILGSISLIITSYLMLFAIEGQLNGIWSMRKRKFSFLSSISLYSLFILSGFIITATIITLNIYSHIIVKSKMLDFLVNKSFVVLVVFMLFFLCYKIMPNHKVNTKYALIAATISACIFSIIKAIFILYTQALFVNYHIIYGSLAIIPITLIWIYINFLNLIFCAGIILALEQGYRQDIQNNFISVFNNFKVNIYSIYNKVTKR